jgi:predicted DNA-binding WGR domain protein
MTERIFHCSEGAAHKFWTVGVDGGTQTVRWGRIGTAGQEQTKTFDTADAAQDATAKLIAAKVKKGYVEVSAAEASRVTPKPTSRQKLAPWRQMLLPFDEQEALSAVLAAPPASPAKPVAATLELF